MTPDCRMTTTLYHAFEIFLMMYCVIYFSLGSLLVRMSEELKKRGRDSCESQPSHQDPSGEESTAVASSCIASDSLEQNVDTNTDKTPPSKLPNEAIPQSDAILSCPACMSTLCLDCQRYAHIPY